MEHTGKRALVLAGGGAKGSYQIGVWRALQELDWTPDIITGASVGTLNGCLFTMGKIQEAEDLWRSLEIHDVLEVPATLKPEELRAFFLDIIRSGGLNVEPLAEMIDRLIDEEAVRTSPIHFGLVMTELGSLRSVQCPIEDIPEGQLKDYMLASSACFPALRPREIDGVKYIDGGWRDNMPLDLAAKMGAAELLGVDVDGIGIVRPNTTGLPTRIVRSHWDLGPTLDFDPARAGRNIALGYFDTLRLFGRCGGTAYALLPDNEETIKATKQLAKEGFVVMPYMFPDPIAAKRLEDAGAACVMPLGAMIGSNKGLRARDFIEVIIKNSNVPVIIDAGIGRPSQAAEAMEMGADAVMAYTAIASAGNIPLMARAFKKAIEAGREAYLSGLGKVTEDHAVPSSPTNEADYIG